MGRAGFEPAKVKTNRFTVCPRWPLEYLPQIFFMFNQSRWRDSNPRPADYKSAALSQLSYIGFLQKKDRKNGLQSKYYFFGFQSNNPKKSTLKTLFFLTSFQDPFGRFCSIIDGLFKAFGCLLYNHVIPGNSNL